MEVNKNKGYSLIELILVMVLLILFGLTTFTLVIAGSSTYGKLTKNKNSNSELRVALSYVNMKVRQNDSFNSISIRRVSREVGDAVVISKLMGEKPYETWIYCSKGILREALLKKGINHPSDAISTEIAVISGFKVYFINNRNLYIEVSKPFGTGNKAYSSIISLKANQ
jgi:type II secretory pathway pseudopilin PulG